MRVKICGITNFEDAMVAIDAGADALGFVFYEKSPRYIDPQIAGKIISELPPFVEKVALFVNETAEYIDKVCQISGATLAQIHFEAESSLFRALQTPHIKVVRAQKAEDIKQYENEYRLIDAYCEAYGGSGKRLNLEWFEGVDCSKIVLAGGLSVSNLKEVIPYGFYGVDVSSGVERSKGLKDHQKVREFIFNAKY